MLSPVTAIEAATKSRVVRPEIAATLSTVRRLQEVLGKSIHTRREVKRILVEQGFISLPSAP
jgi:hypothetical protein